MAAITVVPRSPQRRSFAYNRLTTYLFPARSAAVPVAGLARHIEVQIASTPGEWEQAFQLVADKYQARGYAAPGAEDFRFTSYHALPETRTFVARHGREVVATLSLVFDNHLLGLPLESIYAAEVRELRRAGRRLVEVTSLADTDLGRHEFLPVFVALMRLLTQYALGQGADTLVITINPHHRYFYCKGMGFVPIGARRAYPVVQNHPAEALLLTTALL